MLIVVFGHALDEYRVGGYYFENAAVSYNTNVFDIIRSVIYSFHMPLFMSVSGYLFYYEVKKNLNCKNHFQSLKTFICKKIWRLSVPFIFIMYLWRKPISYLLNPESVPTNLIEYLKFGTTGPLWYLYVLFAIFIIQKLFMWQIWKNDKHVIAALLTFAVFCYLGMFFQSTIRFVLTFNFYFFLGALVNKRFDDIKKLKRKAVVIFILLTVVLEILHVISTSNMILDNLMSICLAIIVLMVIWALSANVRHMNVSRTIAILDKNGMGIYLLHSEILNIASFLLVRTMVPITASLIITTGFGIFAAFLLTEIIRRLQLGIILGEFRPRKGLFNYSNY